MKSTTIAALAGLFLAGPLTAQTVYDARVAAALKPSGHFPAPICSLKGDFRSNSASLYLKNAVEGFQDQGGGHSVMDDKKYVDGVNKAIKAATDAAIATPGNAAAWYFLGRADLQLGDLRGADSALTKAQALAPDCVADIQGYQQKGWYALVNQSVNFMRDKQYDSAVVILRTANRLSQQYPQAFYNLGGTFLNMGQKDSAIYYFKIAQQKATGPNDAAQLKQVTYNLAFLYEDMHDNANTIIQTRKYLAIDSTDVDMRRSLGAALRATGDNAGADQIENQMAASGNLSASEINAAAIRAFNDKDYAKAADKFQQVLVMEPYNHDAAYNLANAYLGLKDGKKLVAATQKLLEIAPLGQTNVQLLVNGYRLMADTTKWIDAVTKLTAMPVSVSIASFVARKDGAKIVGAVTGNDAQNAAGKTIAPAPMTLIFDFLDTKGTVITSQEVPVQALQKGVKQDLALDATGAGITAWRYRVK